MSATAALLLGMSGSGVAQSEYPTKPVHIVVSFAAGGATDSTGRFFAQALSERYGEQFVIDNIPGANGSIGTATVARAAPDGYTLTMGSTGQLIVNPNLYPNVGYTSAEFTPIVHLADLQFVLVARKELGVKTAAELVELSKSKPGTLNYGSAGIGNTQHHAGVLFINKTGADLTHIPYKGGAEAIKAVLAGEVDVLFGTVTETLPLIKSGDLIPIASLATERVDLLPDVPTLAEQGIPDAEVSAWYGLFGPAGMPQEIVAKLNKDLNEILATPEAEKQLGDLGLRRGGGSAEEVNTMLKADEPKWLAIIDLAGGPLK
ncbi:MAG: tripartite tricarboxylate transporter substrate binding protein [Rhizobiales bacterium]|nr:tripartite tricarboxylate transporter substrate binding protein [Hyphomicrobiales bacterium]